jgi:hypothetical protein
MAQSHSSFSVEDNGFLFVNRFSLPFPKTIQFPLVGEIDLGKIVYGLCGGMCFAALDYYYAGQPVPDIQQTEDMPFDYLLYLWDRQLDSFGLATIPKVIEWMLRDDRSVALRTARYELPKMRRQLDKGNPVVMALIRAKGISDPTVNHQVLARGYQFDETTRQMVVHLYDPNFPGTESTLCMDMTKPSQDLQASQSTGESLRGLFVINYNLHKPPQR